jgi:lipid II:glycine glycyltransferase (peptidoglycan interpeptide bridge formation enzyme)
LTGNRFVSLPFSDTCEPLFNDPEHFFEVLENAICRVKSDRWKYFEVRPILCGPAACSSFETSDVYYSHRVDIHQPEELLLKSFHKSVQRKIQRAEREELRYEAGTTESLLKHFYKLLITTRRRQSLPPQPVKWFRTLIDSMGEAMRIHVAFKAEVPVASIVTLSYKKTLVYKYGCNDLRYRNLGGTAMLFWQAIREAKSAGMQELDMGRSDRENTGLVTYKERWGAKRSTLTYWRYPAQAVRFKPERAIKYMRQLISIAPDSSLAMLGNLLYPHIG